MSKARRTPAVRMSKRELMIVRYVVERLESAYRNAEGKAEYARNMDQVMKDIFGMKRFTKALNRARFNEGIMIELMRRLDIKVLWAICRNREHYQMLTTLVALDAEIVKLHKKRDKLQSLEPSERPSGKYKRLCKELKKSEKIYSQCIKRFRDIFDIHKAGGSADRLLDIAKDWKERYDSDYDDIFYGSGDIFEDLDGGFDTMESMDAFIREKTSTKTRGERRQSGAFGLFDDQVSAGGRDFLDDDYDDEPEDDDEESSTSMKVDDVVALLERLGVIPGNARPAPRAKAREPFYARKEPRDSSIARGVYDDDVDDVPTGVEDQIALLAESMTTIQQSVVNQGESIRKLAEIIMTENDDEPLRSTDIPTGSSPQDIMAHLAANAGVVEFDGYEPQTPSAPVPSHPVVDDGRPTAGETVAEGELPTE